MGRRDKRRNRKRKNNINPKIELTKLQKSSRELSEKNIKQKISKLLEYFKKYSKLDEIKKLEEIESSLLDKKYKIAVVANMSAGKSTFINALFGKEVLPSYNHATTDCATYIYSKPNIEKKAKIYFSDNKKPIEIVNELEKEIKQYAQKDKDIKEDKYKNVERIELYYPFKNLKIQGDEDVDIVFIDTPGPNSKGKGYKDKHKEHTRRVIREEVDLALFMFDYERIEAEDDQGLWNTINDRKETDNFFEILFLLNKIDKGYEDNFRDIEENDENQEKEEMKKNWFKNETKKYKILYEEIKNHKIKDPKIYLISSLYELLRRNVRNRIDKQKLDVIKSDFRYLFGDMWEEELIKYTGITKLEDDINTYIKKTINNKILSKIDFELNELINDEKRLLSRGIETLSKPKLEAESNLRQADKFLKNDANLMEREFQKKTLEIQKQYIENIRVIIDKRIENELKKNINEATNRTVKFLELLVSDNYEEIDAINSAKRLPYQKIKNSLEKKGIEIEVTKKPDIELVEKQLQGFIISILNDYKNNYLDMKIEMKNNYKNLSLEIKKLFNDYKQKFEKELSNSLDIQDINLNDSDLYKESIFKDEIKINDSIIDYKFINSKYENGGSFSGRKKIQDEKHFIIIYPKEIKKAFDLSIESIKRTYYNNEIKTFEDTIIDYIKYYQSKFNDFKEKKQEEIEKIKSDLDDKEKKLEELNRQYIYFNDTVEE